MLGDCAPLVVHSYLGFRALQAHGGSPSSTSLSLLLAKLELRPVPLFPFCDCLLVFTYILCYAAVLIAFSFNVADVNHLDLRDWS